MSDPITDPTLRAAVDHNALQSILKAFVTYATLIKLLGGAAGALLIVGMALAGWTVKTAHSASEQAVSQSKTVAVQLDKHVEAEKNEIHQLRVEQAQKIGEVDKKVTKMLDLMLDGTVHIHRRGSIERGSTIESAGGRQPARPPR